MTGSREKQRNEIIRDYLGPGGNGENPRCFGCGEVLELAITCGTGGGTEIRVTCPDCGAGFEWRPTRPPEPWKTLHLEYFMECRRKQQTPRCPHDDCYVICTEFSDSVVEFRCPYCNRRGRARPLDILMEDGPEED